MRTELWLERWACRCRAGPEMLILHMTREISAEKIYPQCTQINDGYSAAQALAANIFDWGAKATVQLYHNGTILEIYRCGIFSAIGFDSFKAEGGTMPEIFRCGVICLCGAWPAQRSITEDADMLGLMWPG